MATVLKLRSVRDQVSPEEWALRQDLACAYRAVAAHGWDDLSFTHLSARVPGPEFAFLLNPFHLGFEEITASSLLTIDGNGKSRIDNGMPQNPAGFTIHSALQMGRPDVNSVMHLHTIAGTAVSMMEFGLLPISQAAGSVVQDIAYHAYEGIAVDLDERERLIAHMGRKNHMILCNHGTLTVGTSIGEAFTRMYFLERACAMQVAALSAGRENLAVPPPGSVEQVHDISLKMGEVTANKLVWPLIRRRMEKLDPSFLD